MFDIAPSQIHNAPQSTLSTLHNHFLLSVRCSLAHWGFFFLFLSYQNNKLKCHTTKLVRHAHIPLEFITECFGENHTSRSKTDEYEKFVKNSNMVWLVWNSRNKWRFLIRIVLRFCLKHNQIQQRRRTRNGLGKCYQKSFIIIHNNSCLRSFVFYEIQWIWSDSLIVQSCPFEQMKWKRIHHRFHFEKVMRNAHWMTSTVCALFFFLFVAFNLVISSSSSSSCFFFFFFHFSWAYLHHIGESRNSVL